MKDGGMMKRMMIDLYERIINNWRSTFTALLIAFGLFMWGRNTINTEELIGYLSVIATTVGLLYKKDEG